MRILRRLLTVLALGAVVALAAVPKQRAPRLARVAGWHKLAATVAKHSDWKLAAPDAAAMSEYGLQRVERADYRRDAQQANVTGFYFGEPRGAYGAFTYFRRAPARALRLGAHRLAASNEGTILFTNGRWLIRVHSDTEAAAALSVARGLAAAMRVGTDASLSWPDLPSMLPRDHQVPGSLHYSEGPAAFAASCSWLPAAAIGFNQSAEAALASYDLPGQPAGAEMLVIAYPTPQIAAAHQAQWKHSGMLQRRSGSLLMVVHGVSEAAAAPLLQSVNYQANFTMVPPKFFGLEGLPALILGTFLLCAIIYGTSLIVGVLGGTLPTLLRHLLPERLQRHRHEAMIRLDLRPPRA